MYGVDNKISRPGQNRSRTVALTLVGGVLLCSLSTAALSEEFSRGQALYEHHCEACHESWAHQREGRKVTSMAELHQRVAAWSVHARLDWSESEVSDVTDYLNRAFYQFESTP